MNFKITKNSLTHKAVYSDVIIDASPEKIWNILMDNDELAKWSTSFQGLKGDLKKGGKVITYMMVGSKVRELKHTLSEYKEGKHFAWSDPLIPGIRDNHNFIIEPVSNTQSKFIQTDEAKGPMVLFMGGMLVKTMKKLYNDFNQKLKEASENK